jgi:hypothetical protein
MVYRKNWVFDIISGGGLTEGEVFNYLYCARIPIEWFTFTFSPEDCKWHTDCGPDYGCWPKPDNYWTFTVVRPGNTSYGLSMRNAAGLGWDKVFCISAGLSESPETLGLRIWHESLHAMGIDSDMLNPEISPNDIDSFKNFVETSDTFKNDKDCLAFLKSPYNHANNAVLRAYYYMLMVNRLGCPAFPIPSGPTPKKGLFQMIIDWLKGIFHAKN